MNMTRQFVAYFYFVGWDCLSFGFHACTSLPNLELHLPFGFVRIGWVWTFGVRPINWQECKTRSFGLSERYDRPNNRMSDPCKVPKDEKQ